MDTLTLYKQAQDAFDEVVAAVGADRWDAPSACPQWSVRDVAGHVIWGQRQLRAWAIGEDYAEGRGAPGSPHPAVLAPGDPVPAWRQAREEAVAALTEENLGRLITLPGLGEVPIAGIVTLLITDQVAHAWDIGHALGAAVRIDPVLVAVAFDWSRAHAVRRPGFFGPERTPPEDADEQTRMLAFLGRAPWEPVTR